jgi:mannosyltransferase OCH1-like enzyme
MLKTFNNIYDKRLWSALGDGSGSGSEISSTIGLRHTLTNKVRAVGKRQELFTLVDAPCGACKWIEVWLDELKNANLPVRYVGFDIAQEPVIIAQQRLRRFAMFHDVVISQCDLSNLDSSLVPEKVDIVLCRDLLQHLTYYHSSEVLKSLSYLKANSYMITTYAGPNSVIEDGGYYNVNLELAPFNMKVKDVTVEDINGEDYFQQTNYKRISWCDSDGLLAASNQVKKIPRIIHHIWLSKTLDQSPPRQYVDFIQSFQEHNPDYEMRLWCNEEIEKLWNHVVLKKFQHLFSKLSIIEKCDATRYAIMFMIGGIYVDLNTECVRSLDPIISSRSVVIVKEPVEHYALNDTHDDMLSNSFLASCPTHPFWLKILDHLNDYYIDSISAEKKQSLVQIQTGPTAFWKYANAFLKPSELKDALESTCKLQPLAYNKMVTKNCEFGTEVVCIKHWWSSSNWGLAPPKSAALMANSLPFNFKKTTEVSIDFQESPRGRKGKNGNMVSVVLLCLVISICSIILIGKLIVAKV